MNALVTVDGSPARVVRGRSLVDAAEVAERTARETAQLRRVDTLKAALSSAEVALNEAVTVADTLSVLTQVKAVTAAAKTLMNAKEVSRQAQECYVRCARGFGMALRAAHPRLVDIKIEAEAVTAGLAPREVIRAALVLSRAALPNVNDAVAAVREEGKPSTLRNVSNKLTRGAQFGRPHGVNPAVLSAARLARRTGRPLAEVASAFKIPRSTFYRQLNCNPPSPPLSALSSATRYMRQCARDVASARRDIAAMKQAGANKGRARLQFAKLRTVSEGVMREIALLAKDLKE